MQSSQRRNLFTVPSSWNTTIKHVFHSCIKKNLLNRVYYNYKIGTYESYLEKRIRKTSLNVLI